MIATLPHISTLAELHAKALNAPREVLTSSQITLLRKLDRAGCAMKARGGWMCAGTWYRDSSFRPLLVLNLADETYFNGHKLRLNVRGRQVVATLAEKRPPAPR
jgi:hypothetical protein